ncbi:MAG: glycosyltransferase [Planctomycetota bacterium]
MALVHVVFVCDVFYPSTESTAQLFTELFQQLANEGLRVHVITNRITGLSEKTAAARPLHCGITVRRVGLTIDGKGSLLLRAVRYALFALSASTCLLLVKTDRFWGSTNPPFSPIWLAFFAWLRRKPLDIFVHDVYPDGLIAMGYLSDRSLLARFWKMLNRYAYNSAEKVVVLGRDMADLIHRQYRVTGKSIVLFPNWSPFDQAAPLPIEQSHLAGTLGCAQSFVVQ